MLLMFQINVGQIVGGKSNYSVYMLRFHVLLRTDIIISGMFLQRQTSGILIMSVEWILCLTLETCLGAA